MKKKKKIKIESGICPHCLNEQNNKENYEDNTGLLEISRQPRRNKDWKDAKVMTNEKPWTGAFVNKIVWITFHGQLIELKIESEKVD